MDRMDKLLKYHDIKCDPLPGEFIVTEKIHGSNFGIGYIKNALRIQTRNRIIDKTFKQFGLPEIIEPLIQIVEKVKDILNYNFLIYGEIFGKTIPVIKYYDPESVDVFGSKEVFFRAFDLYNVDENTFLKYSDAIELFVKVGLPHVPILNINYTTIDDLHVEVEKHKSAFSDECVEGFVLKKNESEIKSSRNIFKVVRKEFCVSKGQLLNKNRLKSYVNYNGFCSAYSKIGDYPEEIKKEMIRDVVQAMIKGINDEVKKEVEELYQRFDKRHKKKQEKKNEPTIG